MGRGFAVLRVLSVVLQGSLAVACESPTSRFEREEPKSKRSYDVIVRRDHDARRAAPVLVALHAYATDPEALVRSFHLVELAVRDRGFVLVVPRGAKDDNGHYFWNASAACCGATTSPPDDLAYLRAVLEEVKVSYAVDAKRVFAIGASNGAFMAHRWACTAGGDLTGIVSIAGMGPGPKDPPCAASAPVQVLQIHGDADEVILYRGGEGMKGPYPSAQRTVDTWLELNGCKGKPVTERSWSLVHGTTEWQVWSGPSATVALWTFEGGSHNLRSVRVAGEEILKFLEAPADLGRTSARP